MNSLTFRSSLLALSLALSAHGANASYKQKEAALRTRVDLEVERYVPELAKAQAIQELYSLVFEKGVGEHFAKSNGLVRQIRVKDHGHGRPITHEEARVATELQGHTLHYPAHFDASQLIADRLADEARTLRDLVSITRELKKETPSLKIVFETELGERLPNSNRSRLEFLNSFDAVLTARSDILSALKRYRSFEIIDRVAKFGEMGVFWHDSDHNVAQLVVGRSGFFNEHVYLDAIALEMLLDIGTIKRFDVKSSFFLSRTVFADALDSLLQVLSDASTARHLRAHGVAGFKINPDFAREEELFSDDTLSVGITPQEIRSVIDLLFP